MNFKTIFLAGPHGVGKGHLSEYLATRFTYPIFSASRLIRDEKNIPIDANKVTIGAPENQDLLVLAMQKISTHSKFIILDGHFSLVTESGFFDVPEITLHNMNLCAIILKTSPNETIQHRLQSRDGKTFDMNTIDELQRREMGRAEFISNRLKIPTFFLEDENYDSISSWIENIVATI